MKDKKPGKIEKMFSTKGQKKGSEKGKTNSGFWSLKRRKERSKSRESVSSLASSEANEADPKIVIEVEAKIEAKPRIPLIRQLSKGQNLGENIEDLDSESVNSELSKLESIDKLDTLDTGKKQMVIKPKRKNLQKSNEQLNSSTDSLSIKSLKMEDQKSQEIEVSQNLKMLARFTE